MVQHDDVEPVIFPVMGAAHFLS